MLTEKTGSPEVARNPSPALVLPLLLIVVCSFTLGACSHILPNSLASSLTESAISIQAALPAASIGEAYTAVLSVSGGTAPYSFAVDQGALPPGLTLNRHTGNISGDPNRAGTFQFTILVTGLSLIHI